MPETTPIDRLEERAAQVTNLKEAQRGLVIAWSDCEHWRRIVCELRSDAIAQRHPLYLALMAILCAIGGAIIQTLVAGACR